MPAEPTQHADYERLCEFDEAAQSLYCVRCGAWVKNERQHADFHADLDHFRAKELGG